VTAELALGLPLVLALTVGLVWVLAVASAQIRVVDAAREAARSIARGDDESSARSVALRIAPAGASLDVATRDGQVTVTSRAEVEGPGGLFDFMPGVTVTSQAVAVMEEP
jgi:Flp pilus assembly protein TadG